MGKQPEPRNKQRTTEQTLLIFLDGALSNFKSSKFFNASYHEDINEDDLTSALNKHLTEENRKQEQAFDFENQAPQENRRTADIAVYLQNTDGSYIFFIEAKWTNAHDYVYENTGAIKRFKKLDHGINNPNPNYKNRKYVKESAIVGYHRLKQGFQKTQEKINDKISSLLPPHICKFELTWDKNEILKDVQQGKFDNHISHHERKDGSSITLHHLWIKIK